MSFNSFIHCVLLLIVLSLVSLSLNKVLATILGIRSRAALVRRGRRVCRIWIKQIKVPSEALSVLVSLLWAL
ncbi:hypothetical protein QBC45DRAFT_398585 [Copromyces sp. CBS 386.78]|nr:hypothetical protein QBC45DRAFT_398585 [Copromyces sp. CBS 386.78]